MRKKRQPSSLISIGAELLPIIILIAVVALYFLPLFYPVLQIYVTPDSTLSDILHFNYPLKHLLSEALKNHSLPLWTDQIGTGLPLLGEGQIQALSLINLALFSLFPLPIAFNLQYVIIFLSFSVGMYVVARAYGWSNSTALFCALIFAFSSHFIMKVPHVNCLQGLSYVPFVFLILIRLLKNIHSKLWIFLPLLISQQICQSHYQYVFICFVFYFLFIALSLRTINKSEKTAFIGNIGIAFLLGIGLAFIQLVPSFEYFTFARMDTTQRYSWEGSYQLSHLLQFLSPTILGDIRSGTYPIDVYSITPWETCASIGFVPFVLMLCSLYWFRKNSMVFLFWIITFVSFIFIFGSNSPLYVLFSLPPLSWFRVPSRFIGIIPFIAVILAGFVFEKLQNTTAIRPSIKWFIVCAVFCVSMWETFSFARFYNPTRPLEKITAKPPLLRTLSRSDRMLAFPSYNQQWYFTLYTSGWKNPDDYLYLLNSGHPNYQVIHGVSSLSAYSGYLPQKEQLLEQMIFNGSTYDSKTKLATLSATAITSLRLHNTEYIISPYNITNPETEQVGYSSVDKESLGTFILYRLSDVKKRYYLTSKYESVYYAEDYSEKTKTNDALSGADAFIASTVPMDRTKSGGDIRIMQNDSTRKRFELSATTSEYFIASLFLYPGWIAFLDGKQVPILPANLSGMAICIPEGNHILELTFVPKSLYIGAIVSGITAVVYLLVILWVYRTSS